MLAKSSYPLRRLHRAPEAKIRIEQAFTILRDTKDYPAERIRLGSYGYTAMGALADYEAEAGILGHALDIYEELLRKVSAGAPKPETSLPDAVQLSRLYTVVAVLNRRADRNERATSLHSRRLEPLAALGLQASK